MCLMFEQEDGEDGDAKSESDGDEWLMDQVQI